MIEESKNFTVAVGLYHGSVLSPFLCVSVRYMFSIQFNSLFQTHIRSISHKYVSQHNRNMEKQHINLPTACVAYPRPWPALWTYNSLFPFSLIEDFHQMSHPQIA